MKKKLLRITAKTRTQLHIGSHQREGDVSDSLFRRNAEGNLTIPGTAIAGAIRSHLTRIAPAITNSDARKTRCDALTGKTSATEACGCIVCQLMGDIRPLNTFVAEDTKAARAKKNGRASKLIIHDATVETSQSTYIRDGVGIDRVTGTASRAGSVKFDYETLPKDTAVEFRLELEDASDTDILLLDVALSEWQAGRIRLGGNVNRGLGNLTLEKIEEAEFDLGEPQQLMRWLRREVKYVAKALSPFARQQYFEQYEPVPHSLQCWVQIDFKLEGKGFFLSNDFTTAMSEQRDHYALDFLPGSALRGVIRSQAERIARTIANLKAESETDFLERCAAADPFVTAESGHTTGLMTTASRIAEMEEKPDGPSEEEKQGLDEDQSLFDLSERLFGTTLFGSRLIVEDAQLEGKPNRKPIDFVAIDRFTGGAADGAKFDAVALWKPVFNCRMFLESPKAWEIGWLMQVLRDLNDGRITVGFGGAKGFGEVNVTNLGVTVGYTYPKAVEASLGGSVDKIDDAYFTERPITDDELTSMIGWWMGECYDAISEYRVDARVPHSPDLDPYWGDAELLDLYAKETNIHDYLPNHE